MFYWITQSIVDFFNSLGLHESLSRMFGAFIVILGLVLGGLIVAYAIKTILYYIVRITQRRRPFIWWEELLDKKFFLYIAVLIPLFVIQKIIPQFLPKGNAYEVIFTTLANIMIIINIMMIVSSFLKALTDVLLKKEATKDKPIKSYVQIVSIIFWAITVILIISVLVNKSPAGLLAGIGAFSAVLLLVFQDTIIGFVNSIQLSSNDLLRNGDWITMNKYGVDGDVEEVNLISVKVRNFDKTISTIPVKQLVADSFQNWRAIQDLGIRRIKRSFNVDVTTIKPCTSQMLEKFKKVALIEDYIIRLQEEVEAYNDKIDADTTITPNGRHQTNIGVLRAYILAYLKNNPNISSKGTLMVRQLAPGEYGLPIELYCFTATAEWVKYENIQSDIFDHIYSVLDYFEIRAFQRDADRSLAPGN